MGVESSEVSVASFIHLLEELNEAPLDSDDFDLFCGGIVNNPAAL